MQKPIQANAVDFNPNAKMAQSKSAAAFSQFLKAYIRDYKDSKTAIIMANRMGIVLSEAKI